MYMYKRRTIIVTNYANNVILKHEQKQTNNETETSSGFCFELDELHLGPLRWTSMNIDPEGVCIVSCIIYTIL